MPYDKVTELPDSVKDNLPKHAQEIYKEAFNNAWNQYKDPEKRQNESDSREQAAHQVAWGAVKQKYKKQDGDWVKKDN